MDAFASSAAAGTAGSVGIDDTGAALVIFDSDCARRNQNSEISENEDGEKEDCQGGDTEQGLKAMLYPPPRARQDLMQGFEQEMIAMQQSLVGSCNHVDDNGKVLKLGKSVEGFVDDGNLLLGHPGSPAHGFGPQNVDSRISPEQQQQIQGFSPGRAQGFGPNKLVIDEQAQYHGTYGGTFTDDELEDAQVLSTNYGVISSQYGSCHGSRDVSDCSHAMSVTSSNGEAGSSMCSPFPRGRTFTIDSDISVISGRSDRRAEESEVVEMMSRLSSVARQRGQKQSMKQGLQGRLKAALQSGDAVFFIYRLLCEVADCVLTKFQAILGDSPMWYALIGGDYVPGSAICLHMDKDSTTNEKSAELMDLTNPFLDCFLQISCGWTDASVAFGPIKAPQIAIFASGESANHDDGDGCFGTLAFTPSLPKLPPGPLTTKITSLISTVSQKAQTTDGYVGERNALQRKGDQAMIVLRFKAAVLAALQSIERIELGLGGTVKHPTEYQMKYVQRVNDGVAQGLDKIIEAVNNL